MKKNLDSVLILKCSEINFRMLLCLEMIFKLTFTFWIVWCDGRIVIKYFYIYCSMPKTGCPVKMSWILCSLIIGHQLKMLSLECQQVWWFENIYLFFNKLKDHSHCKNLIQCFYVYFILFPYHISEHYHCVIIVLSLYYLFFIVEITVFSFRWQKQWIHIREMHGIHVSVLSRGIGKEKMLKYSESMLFNVWFCTATIL